MSKTWLLIMGAFVSQQLSCMDFEHVLKTSNDQAAVTRAYKDTRNRMPLVLRCYSAAKVDNEKDAALCFNAGVKPMDAYCYSEVDINTWSTPFWAALCYKSGKVISLCMRHGASAFTLMSGVPALTRMFNNQNKEAIEAIINNTQEDLFPIFKHPKFEWGSRSAKHLSELMPFLVTRLGVKVIEYLISKNISMHEADHEGFYPIHRAVQCGNLPMVEVLVKTNRKTSQLRSGGWLTPVMIAAFHGQVSCVELLWHKNDIKHVDSTFMTALDHAIVNGWLNVAQVIMPLIKKELGNNVEEVFFKDKEVLHKALYNNHFQSCSYLLSEGADVSCVDRQGNLPLHIAVFKKECPEELLKQLIEQTAKKDNINKRNGLRRTALDIATVSASLNVQELLRQKNARLTLELHSK